MDKGVCPVKTTPFFTMFLFVAAVSQAAVRFTATTDHTNVTPGEQVVVVAELVTDKELADANIPPLPSNEAFDCAKTDRNQSSSSSIQIINGKATQSHTITYQFYYVIVPKKAGPFTFPPLEISVNGSPLTTSAIAFNVTAERVKNPDIRVSTSMSKQPLYVGEQAILTFKVAVRANSPTQVEKGFNAAVEALEKSLGKTISFARLFTNQVTSGQEHIGGEMYRTFLLRWAVIPLSGGTVQVPSVPFAYAELQQSRQRQGDPFFGDFFGGDFFGRGVQAISRTAFSNELSVRVKDLPPKPAGFSGSIGKISLSAAIEPGEVPAGEAATLKITLSASTRPGNVAEIVLPTVQKCEIFSPEKHVQVDTTPSGIMTKKSYKFLLIPQEEGALDLPPIELSYFDPYVGAYKTASSGPLSLMVTKGKKGIKPQTRYLTQEEIREVGSDIRYIKTGIKVRSVPERPYREPWFLLLYSLPFLIVIVSLLIRFQSRHREKNAAQQIKQRALRAAISGLDRLKKQGMNVKADAFLSSVADTIERYISQKFEFAATGRTLDELKNELLARHADAAIVNDLSLFIEQLDSYRFGGAAFDEKSRAKVLEKASVFLSGLEKSAKKGKKPVTVPLAALPLLLIQLFCSATFSAPVDFWLERGNQFYSQQQYDSAIVFYEKIVAAGATSPSVFFNLGNAYFRNNKPGYARLCYEKAAQLDPADKDIAANIRFVASNIVDRVPEPERGFVETMLWQLHIFMPLHTQLWFCFVLLLLISLLVSAALFMRGTHRLWLVYVSSLLSLVLLFGGLSMGVKIYRTEKTASAILLEPSIDARNEPDGAKVIFTAHEGTKFLIRKSIEGWSLVSLPTGLSGWVENKALGKI
jgi:tetratricopeptide (TPR) repeat protein